MSVKELQRIEVVTNIFAGRRDMVSGAAVLAISVRQLHRSLARYRERGDAALVHKARERRSKNQLTAGVRDDAWWLHPQRRWWNPIPQNLLLVNRN